MKKALLQRDKNKNKVEYQKSKQEMFNDIFDEPFGKKREEFYKNKIITDQINKGPIKNA